MSTGSYTSPQVCTRCRQKKIRCDLRLPSCKHCAAAEVQCSFWDPILGKTVYCGYLHFLHERESSLKRKIQQRSTELGAPLPPSQGNDVIQLAATENDRHGQVSGDIAFASPQSHLGPGHSAEMVQRFLKAGLELHKQKQLALPRLNVLDHAPPYHSQLESDRPRYHAEDLSKADLLGLLTSSTKNALTQHYLRVVVPEYNFLAGNLQSLLHVDASLELDAPDNGNARSITRLIVLTISLALVVRDSQSPLADVFFRFRHALKRLIESGIAVEDPLERQRLLCAILIAQVLCELVSPETYQVWDLLGAAGSVLDELRLGYRSHHLSQDEAYLRLECVLLKLEGSAVLHFQRPSSFPGMRSSLGQGFIFEQSTVWSSVGNIAQTLIDMPTVSLVDAVALIPPGYRVDQPLDRIELSSALLYTTLQPLFTTVEMLSGKFLEEQKSVVFDTVARSACMIIEHVHELNKDSKVLSVWLETDRVLRCGMTWLYYLVHRSRKSCPEDSQSPLNGDSMSPILQVTSLLSSFAVRYEGASASLSAWEACITLLWPMLSSGSAELAQQNH